MKPTTDRILPILAEVELDPQDAARLRALREQETELLTAGQFAEAAPVGDEIDGILAEAVNLAACVAAGDEDVLAVLRNWSRDGVPSDFRGAFIDAVLTADTTAEGIEE